MTNSRQCWLAVLAVSVLVVAAAACGSGGGAGSPTIETHLTNGAVPPNNLLPGVTSAVVTVVRVDAHRSGGSATVDTAAEPGTAGWVVLTSTAQVVDLMQIAADATAVLGSETVSAGRYNQVRLLLASGATVTVNGETESLQVPSGSQTGIKIVGNFDVEAGKTYTMTLDFDTDESIKVNGQGYRLDPVIQIESFEEQ